jgi:hypothetical protein
MSANKLSSVIKEFSQISNARKNQIKKHGDADKKIGRQMPANV